MHFLLALLLAAGAASAQDGAKPAKARWFGDAQYKVDMGVGRKPREAAVPTILEIAGDGRVRGGSKNGCRFSGIVLPGARPGLLQLELQFSRCQYTPFNRRYAGTLDLEAGEGGAYLRLGAQQEERAGVKLAIAIEGRLASR